jgi:hypothetical protein
VSETNDEGILSMKPLMSATPSYRGIYEVGWGVLLLAAQARMLWKMARALSIALRRRDQ